MSPLAKTGSVYPDDNYPRSVHADQSVHYLVHDTLYLEPGRSTDGT
jgi:hypothetical protein